MPAPSHKIDRKSREAGVIVLCLRIDFLDRELKMDKFCVNGNLGLVTLFSLE